MWNAPRGVMQGYVEYRYVDFIQAKNKKKKKESLKFKPTSNQIETAKERIEGVFEKHHGSIDAVDREALLTVMVGAVFNRGNQLGDYEKGESAVVIQAALNQLVATGQIRDAEGSFGIMWYTKPPRRRHTQKIYPNRGQRQRQRFVA